VELEAAGQDVGWVSGPRIRGGHSVDDSARVWIGLREGGNPGCKRDHERGDYASHATSL
jgi:hypothetical protein